MKADLNSPRPAVLVFCTALLALASAAPADGDETSRAETETRDELRRAGAFEPRTDPSRLDSSPAEHSTFHSFNRSLAENMRRWAETEDVLGEHRARDLSAARAALWLDATYLDRDLHDDPYTLNEVRDAAWDAFRKVTRERLEHRLGLDGYERRRAERRRAQAESDRPWRLRLSPEVSVGSRSYLGMRLRLPAARGALSRVDFRTRYLAETDATSLALRYRDGDRYFFVEHIQGDDRYGDQLALKVRWLLF